MKNKSKEIGRLTIVMPYEMRMQIRKLAAQNECSSAEWLRRVIKKSLAPCTTDAVTLKDHIT